MGKHDLSRTTHTPELRQVQELNDRLAAADRAGERVTAESLELTGASVESAGASIGAPTGAPAGGLPAGAVLDHLSAEGPPDFPYLAGRFRVGSGDSEPTLQVALHTPTLRRLSHRFGLHHVWGA